MGGRNGVGIKPFRRRINLPLLLSPVRARDIYPRSREPHRLHLAVHTDGGKEFAHAARLRSIGGDVFLPFVRKRMYRGRLRRMREILSPLFPRYLFVNGVAVEHIERGHTARVVRCRLSRMPVEIENASLAHLRELGRATAEGFEIDSDKLKRFLAMSIAELSFRGSMGQKIRLDDDAPYFGRLAEICSLTNLSRGEVGVLIDILGARRFASIPTSAIVEYDRSGSR